MLFRSRIIRHGAAGGFSWGPRPDRTAAARPRSRRQRTGRTVRHRAAGGFSWGPRPDRPTAGIGCTISIILLPANPPPTAMVFSKTNSCGISRCGPSFSTTNGCSSNCCKTNRCGISRCGSSCGGIKLGSSYLPLQEVANRAPWGSGPNMGP